jgi:hypothetical protein
MEHGLRRGRSGLGKGYPRTAAAGEPSGCDLVDTAAHRAVVGASDGHPTDPVGSRFDDRGI